MGSVKLLLLWEKIVVIKWLFEVKNILYLIDSNGVIKKIAEKRKKHLQTEQKQNIITTVTFKKTIFKRFKYGKRQSVRSGAEPN